MLIVFYFVQKQEVKVSSAAPGSLQHTLEERTTMYKTALQNAKAAGESSKARRYDRGLKVSDTRQTFFSVNIYCFTLQLVAFHFIDC